MTNKPNLMTENEMTPEGIVANTHFSRNEKLRRLKEMKAELDKDVDRIDAGLSEVEERMAAISAAIAEVKRQQADDDSAIAIGRAPSA